LSLFNELKRRNVFRVAAAYIIVGWLIMQAGEVMGPALRLPEWVNSLLVFFLILGFPLAIFFAWAFELTPDGLKKEKDIDKTQSITRATGQKLNYIIIVLMAVALAYFAWDKFVSKPESEAELAQVSPATEQTKMVALSSEQKTDKKSIAVLPFQNRSANEENAAFFSDGVHDELLTNLSRIKALKVISRTSVMNYRDNTKNLRLVGEELGVANILEGGVQRAGDRVRINVQLIDAKTDEHIWADIYDRQLTATNIFQIQSEIATAIADALQASLLPIEQKRLETIPTENLAALEAYFLGKQALARRTGAALAEAISYFKKAVELDPGFVLAYVGHADSYILQVDNGNLNPKKAFELAKPLIDKALELDDQSGEAYATLALSVTYLNDPDIANAAFQRALEIDPNYVSTYHWYSNFLRDYGLYDAGMKQIKDAIRLDPLSAVLHVNLGTVLYELGRPEEALARFKQTIEMEVDFPLPYWCIGGIYWTHFGQLDEALTWFKQALERNPGNARLTALIGLLYLDLGGEAEAEHWINSSLELQADGIFSNWAKEMLLLSQGESTQATNYAAEVLQQEPGWAISLADLRNQDLLMGLATDASARYEKQFPMLFQDDDPKIDRSNVDAAINLGLVMTSLGRPARAQLLLDRSLDYAESTSMPRLHWYPVAYGIQQQVQIYALQGKTEKALEALRQAVDNNWRGFWWYWLEHDPNLGSIRGEPAFKAMVEEIKLDMAKQLERVRLEAKTGAFSTKP
jgi:TolB-like protein/Tfp pilus assembly protein PilF